MTQEQAISRRTYIAFVMAYFLGSAVHLFVNAYLPVYIINVLGIPREDLVVVQILSFSPLLLKPVLSYLMDLKMMDGKRRLLTFGTVYSSFAFMVLFIYSLPNLILFTLFLSLSIGLVAFTDVLVDKILILQVRGKAEQSKTGMLMLLGVNLSNISINVVFFILSPGTNPLTWNLTIVAYLLFLAPSLVLVLLLQEPPVKNAERSELQEEAFTINWTHVAILSLFFFLYNSDSLIDWVLEPWIVERWGEGYLATYSLFMVLWTLIYLVGLITGNVLTKRVTNRPLMVTFLIIGYGVIMTFAGFQHVMVIFLLISLTQLIIAIAQVGLFSIMLEETGRKGLPFQLITVCSFLSRIVFLPLGTFLSTVIDVPYLILAHGLIEIGASGLVLLLRRKKIANFKNI